MYKNSGNLTLVPLGTKFEAHLYAALVPMASDAEQASLTEDIRTNGLREPIILWKGKIVDGRCRQKACLVANMQLSYVELEDELPDEEVALLVKSLNTRRNLTHTQKVMVAAKESMKAGTSTKKQAKLWSVSEVLVKNARWLIRNYSEVADSLFNGKSVELKNGNTSNKVSTIYAHYKELYEDIQEDTEHGWEEDTYIETQTGKNWYYKQIAMINAGDNTRAKMLIAELANYKFKGDIDGEN